MSDKFYVTNQAENQIRSVPLPCVERVFVSKVFAVTGLTVFYRGFVLNGRACDSFDELRVYFNNHPNRRFTVYIASHGESPGPYIFVYLRRSV